MDRPEPSPLWYIRLVRFVSGSIVLLFLVGDFFAHFQNWVDLPGDVGLAVAYGTDQYELAASIALGYVSINFLIFLLTSALLELLDPDGPRGDHAGDPPGTDA